MSKIVKSEVFENLYQEIVNYIHNARKRVIKTVNFEMIYAYWNIGRKIVEIEQEGKERAKYGKNLLERLSELLMEEFGKGYSTTNLKHFRKLYLTYPNRIGHAVSDEFKLSWTHYRVLMKESREDVRQFYELEAVKNNWSTRELERQTTTSLYERLAKSRDKEGVKMLSQKGQIIEKPQDALKEPVVLEFLDIPESHKLVESKLEEALITHLQHFLLELGSGFAFVSRQKRITLDGDHFYTDLVFYHTILKCYVILEIKTEKLTHQDIGQMQMYVHYYDRKIITEGDNPTIGLLLCAEKNDLTVKYTLDKDNKQIFASKYQFHLPTEEELTKEVQREVQLLENKLDKEEG